MLANKIINTGLKQLGKPYVFNAPSYQMKTFDCSSFIQYIFSVNGVYLPRNSRQQFKVGKRISFHKMKKGDLLFFTSEKRKNKRGIARIGHVALYIGSGKILHTTRTEKQVHITRLDPYWKTVYLGAKRVL